MSAAVIAHIGHALSGATHVAGAFAAITVAAWLIGRRRRFGPAGDTIVAAHVLTAAWCLAVALFGFGTFVAGVTETLRNLAWLVVIYRLFQRDGRHQMLSPVRPLILVLMVVEVLHFGIDMVVVQTGSGRSLDVGALGGAVLLRLLVAVGALVLVHNLYAGASGQSRRALRLPAAGLALLWAVDFNLYAIAYVAEQWPVEIAASRGIVAAGLAVLMAVSVSGKRTAPRLRPSRAVTFQTLSLLVLGAYFAAMVAIANWLSLAGGNFARLMELVFLVAGCLVAALALPSRRLRGWFKVILAKHFFQHRYDYREEWMRFTRTIGGGSDPSSTLEQRVVQAVADVADSPAGLLLTPGDQGELVLAGRWLWSTAEVPAVAMNAHAIAFFERESFVADLDLIRAGQELRGEGFAIPEWLRDEARAWALVPLIHFDRLVGMVVLARPVMARRFDWEDFDLLRVVGRQSASYLAENTMQGALAEASRFDDFNRRIAFVMHDIKNLASQLSLLARNAERHADNPAFRDDMLLTLRNSADKLNTLLARLSRYGGGVGERIAAVAAGDVARGAVDRFRGAHSVTLVESNDCIVMANREALEQVMVHLIQNAVDASDAGAPVFVSQTTDGLYARLEIVDSGSGMSAEFIRSRLFKPFDSSKAGGFGIGAFEARELVRAMQGRLEVESREGLGSRFIIRLPLAAAQDQFDLRAAS